MQQLKNTTILSTQKIRSEVEFPMEGSRTSPHNSSWIRVEVHKLQTDKQRTII